MITIAHGEDSVATMDHLQEAKDLLEWALREEQDTVQTGQLHALIAIAEELRTMNARAVPPQSGPCERPRPGAAMYPLPKPKGHRLDGEESEYK